MSGRILLVDDDADIREVVAAILEDAGYEVVQAGGGAEALDRLGREPLPDLILLDLTMPGINGWKLSEELAQREGLAAIPVVVMSGDSMMASRGVELHAAGLLAKPFDEEQLLTIVARCIADPAARLTR